MSHEQQNLARSNNRSYIFMNMIWIPILRKSKSSGEIVPNAFPLLTGLVSVFNILKEKTAS